MSNSITVINRLIKLFTGASTLLALISMFSMMLLITFDVLLNKIVGRPIPGSLEITSYYLMVLLVFFTLAQIEKNQSHISADFIVARFRPKIQRAFDVIGKLLTITFYSLLAYAATGQAIRSTRRMETVMSNFTFYIWPARWGVVFGIVTAILVTVMILVLRLKDNPQHRGNSHGK